jgi:hypothetical protein
MSSGNSDNINKVPFFHPSLFEKNITGSELPNENNEVSDAIVLENTKMLLPKTDLKEKGRKFLFGTTDVYKIRNKGAYTRTTGVIMNKSNTNSLFKNLHGETLLTNLFFSDLNVQSVQKLIRLNVYKTIDVVIDEQSVDELLIVMRSIYLQFSRHPPLLTAEQPIEIQEKIIKKTVEQVERLNLLVVNEVVPLVISGVKQHIAYLKDASQPPEFMEKPVSDSIRGQRELRSVTSVLTGQL